MNQDAVVVQMGAAERGVSPPHRRQTLWRRLRREPLVHFVAIGAALFLAMTAYQHLIDPRRIAVTRAHVAKLANGYALQFGEPPDPRTLDALVAQDLHNEILYRQGLALGLDKDDEIVRRRVIQKMAFLTQDLNAPAEPSEAQLRGYYAAHAARYIQPVRVDFTHIYFAPDRDGWEKARARARAVLPRLSVATARAPQFGDPFPDLYDYANYDPGQLRRLFGDTPVTQTLLSAPAGAWIGPVKSAYGWHLVRITGRAPASTPSFADVRDQVRTDALHELQTAANRAAFDRLARQYIIVRADRRK